jgi:hypothetical protein
MLQRLLEKISWKTRNWNLSFSLFTLSLHDQQDSWGFSIFTIHLRLRSYSFLGLEFRLPNKTTVQELSVDWWDFLWLRNYLWKVYDDLSDRKLWGSKLGYWDSIKLITLERIFK